MNRISKIAFLPLIAASFLLNSCSNGPEEQSSYADILSQPPYAGLTDSIRHNKKDPQLYFRRAQQLKKNNLPEPALADFEKAWSLQPAEEYAANISNLLLDKQPDSAISFIHAALQKIPNSIFLQLDLARAYMALNKNNEALTVCNAITAKYPNQVDALMMKSDLLNAQKDTAGSINALEQAYQLAPFDVELNYDLAFAYAQDKNPRVLSLCDSLILKDSLGNHAEPYYFKGVYYANIHDEQKALDLFTQAISHDYNFLDAYLDKGRILFRQQKNTAALKVFQLAATISPAYADAYYWMGKCQEALGQKAEAKTNYLRAWGFDKSLTEAKAAADRL
jgi:tetratricopeptide (TPR) repeat protein